MKRTLPGWFALAMAVMVPAWLLSVPASAAGQRAGGSRGGGSHGGGSQGSGSHGSGSTRSSGSSGSTRSSGSSSGGSSKVGSGSGSSASSGSSGGGAQSRGSHGGGSREGSSTATRGDSNPSGGSSGTTSSGGDTAIRRGSDGGTGNDGTRGANPDPPHSRPREGRPAIGEAVPRTGPPPVRNGRGGHGGGGTIFVPGYYPWGFGGIGLGYYDPWDPWGAGYGGYYGGGYYGGGYYDGGAPQYLPPPESDSALRLKVKPRDASVYVDGYYAGAIDDFDGLFQRLRLESGPHRIEIRAPGYETLAFDVRLDPDRTTTYTGELRRIQ